MSQDKLLPTLEPKAEPRWRRYLIDSILAIAGSLIVTGVIYVFHLYPSIPNISLVYLLIVLPLASTRGQYAAIVASLVASFSFDVFLVPPLYTFTIGRSEEWVALSVFLVTAIITGQLAAALRQRAEQANLRERETRILYELVRATNNEENLERQLSIVAQAVVSVFSSWGVRDCSILLPDSSGKLRLQASAHQPLEEVKLSPDEEATATWVMAQAQSVELHDATLAQQTSSFHAPRVVVRDTTARSTRRYLRMLPLKTGQKIIGVVRLAIEDDPQLFSVEDSVGVDREHSNPRIAFFWTFLDQAISIIERARLRRESLRMELLQRTDALRLALLSSVSHDLRTPLSSIKAAATSLLQQDVQWDDETRRGFALTIERQTDRLNRLVGNLLDMSRIEGGVLKPEKEWYPIAELIHDVLGHMQPILQGRIVHTSLPDDLPPVQLDYLQIDQVLSNLIENAAYYTPAEQPIEISAQVEGQEMMITVADHGPGIPQAEREHIFDKFFRVLRAQRNVPRTGSGLGLAVCRGLVEAHGGRIWVEDRKGGGAIFRFTLPLGKPEGMQHE